MESGKFFETTVNLIIKHCPLLLKFVWKWDSELKVEKEVEIKHELLKLISLRSVCSKKGYIHALNLKGDNLEVCELGRMNVFRVIKSKHVVVRKIGAAVGSIVLDE